MGFLRWLRQAVLFLVLAALVPVTAIGLWVRLNVLDTDRYVQTVAPLSAEPEVQAEITRRIMAFLDDLAASADTGSDARNRIVRSAYDGARGQIEDVVGLVLTSDQFGRGWEAANRAVHAELSQLLRGDLPAGADGTIRISLVPVFEEVKAELNARGISVLDDVEPSRNQLSLTLLESDELHTYRRYVDIFELAVIGLAILAAVLGLGYVWGAKSTLLGIAGLCVIVAISMAAVWVAIRLGRDVVVGDIVDDGARAAAATIYDRIVATPRDRSVVIAPAGVAAALVFWLIHRSRRKPVYIR